MCGIIGYVGPGRPADILLDGLKRLEYRGYDSAGMAVLNGGGVRLRRSVGKLRNLEVSLRDDPLEGSQGIGHTRWATHGKPSMVNAHPHKAGPITLVHNGIIENFEELAAELIAKGVEIESETDTEIVAHLIEVAVGGGHDLFTGVQSVLGRLDGAYAFVVQSINEPGRLICARKGSPLVVGFGEGESFVASDLQALLPYTKRVAFLNDDEMVLITPEKITIYDNRGNVLEREPSIVQWNAIDIEKGGHKHFMHKEIFEQPRAVIDSLQDTFNLSQGSFTFIDEAFSFEELQQFERVHLIACGTAFHACQVGKIFIERMARVVCEVSYASEFRYGEPIIDEKTLLIVVSQSGETADTLAAMREGRRRGGKALAVVNVPGSTIAREADSVIFTHAGPEIGVASTKAFTAQLVVLHSLGVQMGRAMGGLSVEDAAAHLHQLARVPQLMEEVLKKENEIHQIAMDFHRMDGFLFLGRGPNYPIALEGALKLKEITYLHAEGYAAGEMKHGPIALVDESMVVLGLVPQGEMAAKMLSNLQEVRAREGKVVIIAEEGVTVPKDLADFVFTVPVADPLIMPILMVIPLQLLAYHVADHLGTDVDQPRNLAKSVTVE
jgi:glutamine---fructose-6-phosphate transaminase (isomerizing)